MACPLHNWTIDFAGGCAKAPDVGRTQQFSVKVEAGSVALDRHELDTLAVTVPATVGQAEAAA